MTPRIRIIRHEVVSKTGSFEVRFADGSRSRYFYWDDVLGRRLRPDVLTSVQASNNLLVRLAWPRCR